MKTRHLLAALAALLALAAPGLASNTGVTIQIPAATVVTSLAASDVTVLDVAGLYLATDVEAALAEVRTRPVYAAAQADVPLNSACTPGTDLQWYYVIDASPDVAAAGAIVACSVTESQWRPLFAGWRHASAHLSGEADAVVADQLETDCTNGQLLIGETDAGSNTGQSVGCLSPSYAAAGAATSSGLTLATARLLGRTTASTGAVEEVTPDSTLSLAAGGLGVVDVTCTGCLGSTEVAGLDAADLTSGTLDAARIPAVTSLSSTCADDEVLGGTASGTGVECQAASGGGGVPGSNGQCIFNDNGALGADGGCSYDKAVNALSVDLVWTNGVRDAAGNTAIDLSAGSFLYAGGGFRLKWNSPSGSFSTYIVPVTNAHDLWLGGIPTTTTYDLTPGTIGLWGIAAAAAASTNIVGGMVPIKGGDGASGSSGDAHGGNVLLDGGRGYGTGDDGQIVIGNTRGSLRLTPRSTPPIACSGHEGTFYIDSDTHKPCYCNGTTYVLFSDDTTTCS